MEKSNCQLLVALPGITMEAGLYLMGLLSGIFPTLIIFLSSHQFISLSLHLLAFRQSAVIPLLTFPYWPQQILSILAWLFLLLLILSAGSLSLLDLCIIFTLFLSLAQSHQQSRLGYLPHAAPSLSLTGSERGARPCKAMVFHWLLYVFSKNSYWQQNLCCCVETLE